MVRRVAVLAFLGVALIAVPQAAAATTIGESYAGSGGVACHYGGTEIQTASDGNSYAAPYDGVITSWSNQGYFWPTITFKVARLGSGASYTVVASDGPRTVAGFSQKENYPVRIPVRQGDVIGGHIPISDYYCVYGGGTNAYGEDDADTLPGGTGSFDAINGGRIPVEATIEHDRDGDGYGDETQDACPTNASTHDACPLPTVLGQTFTPINSSCISTSIPVLPADVRYSAPADGVITSWSHQASSAVDGTIKFKVLRPLGGDDYLAIGDSEPRTTTAGALSSFPTRIPVRQGDRIGLRSDGVGCASNVSALGSSMSLVDDVAPGTSATFNASNRRVDVSAVLEADDDGDGFGDTSQDLCPTDATTQGVCPIIQPLPPPPEKSAECLAAEKKLDKARAKLKKLKKNDAKAKKLDSAAEKVKKAKKAVKKAC
jgi:hypothetical protein